MRDSIMLLALSYFVDRKDTLVDYKFWIWGTKLRHLSAFRLCGIGSQMSTPNQIYIAAVLMGTLICHTRKV